MIRKGDRAALSGGSRTLRCFRRAYRLSLEVHRASLEFPRIEQSALADQLRRASKSICANLAEGFGRQRHLEAGVPSLSARRIGIGRRDAVWALYCLDLGYIERRLRRSAGAGEYRRDLPGCSPAFMPSV